MMSTRRSFFVTGVLLSALVLFGSTAAQAQEVGTAPAADSVVIGSTDPKAFDMLEVTWDAPDTTNNLTLGYRVYWMEGDDVLTATTLQNAQSMNVGIDRDETEQKATLTGLKPDTMYVAAVASRGADGGSVAVSHLGQLRGCRRFLDGRGGGL